MELVPLVLKARLVDIFLLLIYEIYQDYFFCSFYFVGRACRFGARKLYGCADWV